MERCRDFNSDFTQNGLAGVLSANACSQHLTSEWPEQQELFKTNRCKLALLRGDVLGMRRRASALIAAILFILSWIFPVAAGLVRSPTSLPKWWETVDLAVAFVVAVGACVIPGLGQTTYRIYRRSMHAILAVVVVVILAGDRITWANCATGFLWRTWLFLYILPWWLAAAGRPGN